VAGRAGRGAVSRTDVSVVIPCYNGSLYLVETLRSVLDQTHPPLEVIVVDDGSTDGSAEVARAVDPRVHVLQQANEGESVARNRGIEAAKGEWIAFCDADDVWRPPKLERQLELTEPGVVGVHTDYFRFGDDSRTTELSATPSELRYRPERLATGEVVFISSLLVRRGLAARFPAWTRYAEDLVYVLDVSFEGALRLVPEALTGYRVHVRAQSQLKLVETRWHETVEQWLALRAGHLPEDVVRLIRRVWVERLLTALRSARWERRWDDYWAIRRRLAAYADWPEVAGVVHERILPRWVYRVHDGLDRFRRRNSRQPIRP
jgi:glycosyltransferase involved in cell wall biosynthesis